MSKCTKRSNPWIHSRESLGANPNFYPVHFSESGAYCANALRFGYGCTVWLNRDDSLGRESAALECMKLGRMARAGVLTISKGALPAEAEELLPEFQMMISSGSMSVEALMHAAHDLLKAEDYATWCADNGRPKIDPLDTAKYAEVTVKAFKHWVTLYLPHDVVRHGVAMRSLPREECRSAFHPLGSGGVEAGIRSNHRLGIYRSHDTFALSPLLQQTFKHAALSLPPKKGSKALANTRACVYDACL